MDARREVGFSVARALKTAADDGWRCWASIEGSRMEDGSGGGGGGRRESWRGVNVRQRGVGWGVSLSSWRRTIEG
jgi:hypothetical protein